MVGKLLTLAITLYYPLRGGIPPNQFEATSHSLTCKALRVFVVNCLQGCPILQQEADGSWKVSGGCLHQWGPPLCVWEVCHLPQAPPLCVWEVCHLPQAGKGLHAGEGFALYAVMEGGEATGVDAGVKGVAVQEELDDVTVPSSTGPMQCRSLVAVFNI